MQFDIHRNTGFGSERAPYFVDIQSDRVEALRLRVVAPLVGPEFLTSLGALHPPLNVLGEQFILSTSELFAVDQRQLGPSVDNVVVHRHRIISALDMLFTGI